MKISVVGLGKLGACTAACFAYKGYEVIGLDINNSYVEAINNAKAPVKEYMLQDIIDKTNGRLSATSDFKKIMQETDITFLIVPTPSLESGNFSNKYLLDAFRHLALELKNKAFHRFVITSTVSPKATYEKIVPFIEEISGKKLNEGFEIAYNPEFIALGSVINDFLNPDMILIGESSSKIGSQLEEIYKKVSDNDPYIARMSLVSAEITKISLNSFVTMKISFANMLLKICDNIKNANIDDITEALGADKRVAPYYLKGGLSFGGPCFPRDNRAFISFAKAFGVDAKLPSITDIINKEQISFIVDKIMNIIEKAKINAISLIGLSYKPNTYVIEESPAIYIIEKLLSKEIEVFVYDDLAIDCVKALYDDKISYLSSVKECFKNSQLNVFLLPSKQIKSIKEDYISYDKTYVIDCWREASYLKDFSKVKYIPLGIFEENY